MSYRFTCCIVALLAGWIAPPAAAQENLVPALKEQTVKITVTRDEGPVEHGSGVVLCQDQETRKVYVLTAHHVLAGKSDQPSGKKTLRMRRIAEVEVGFFGDSPPPVGKDALRVHQVPGEDLLLLSFPLEQVLTQAATLDTPEFVDEARAEDDRPTIYAIGYLKGEARSWVDKKGKLLPGGGRFVHHTAGIAEGFSGGPLFNRAGSLIGVNVEVVSGKEIGAEVGATYGEALAMDEILPAIDKWMPSKCLKSASSLSELAYLTYRKAMRAVSIKHWKDAEELMEQAIKQHSIEGESVHLEGLRYTPYLPLYHYGLARYKLADRAEDPYQASQHYSAAIRAWERSEAKGEIQKDRRHRSLKRLEAKSYKALQRLSAPKTPAEQAAWDEAEKQAKTARAKREADKAKAAAKRAAELAAKAQAASDALAATEAAREREIAEAAAKALAAAKAAEEEARRRAEAEAARAARRQVVAAATPCARLRAEPSRGARRLDCLEPGSGISWVEELGDWSRVRLADGRQGWIASRLLEQVEAPVEE